jgi:hypothetical protein
MRDLTSTGRRDATRARRDARRETTGGDGRRRDERTANANAATRRRQGLIATATRSARRRRTREDAGEE